MVETKFMQAALPQANAANIKALVQNAKVLEVLDDLCMRFILNAPDEDFESVERLFFNIEEAYWFYADFSCKKAKQEGSHLPNLSFSEFADAMFTHCSFLAPYRHAVEDYTKQFLHYKFKIPANGAIILNETLDKVLLIKGFKSNSWSFPKGKIHKHESELHCAAREVKEEIGFDIMPFADEKLFIYKTSNGQATKLFVIPRVPENTVFLTQTRNEIELIRWHRLDSLDSTAQGAPRKTQVLQNFLKDIIDWCREQNKASTPANNQPRRNKQGSPKKYNNNNNNQHYNNYYNYQQPQQQYANPQQPQVLPRKKSPPQQPRNVNNNNRYNKQYYAQEQQGCNKFNKKNAGSFSFDAEEIVNAF